MFWTIYTFLLIVAEAVFIQRCVSVGEAASVIRKRLHDTAVTDVQQYFAHKKALRRCTMEFVSWIAIASVCSYACVDCFLKGLGA